MGEGNALTLIEQAPSRNGSELGRTCSSRSTGGGTSYAGREHACAASTVLPPTLALLIRPCPRLASTNHRSALWQDPAYIALASRRVGASARKLGACSRPRRPQLRLHRQWSWATRLHFRRDAESLRQAVRGELERSEKFRIQHFPGVHRTHAVLRHRGEPRLGPLGRSLAGFFHRPTRVGRLKESARSPMWERRSPEQTSVLPIVMGCRRSARVPVEQRIE
jgi:hypothetical protein